MKKNVRSIYYKSFCALTSSPKNEQNSEKEELEKKRKKQQKNAPILYTHK